MFHRTFILILLPLISREIVAKTQLDVAAIINDRYSQYCETNYNYPSPLDDKLESLSKSYDVHLYTHFSPKEMEANVDKTLIHTESIMAENSDFKKLDLAYALLISRSNNLSLMKNIIDFTSKNASIEAHRKFIQSHISGMDEDWESSFDHLLDSIAEAPVIHIGMFAGLMNLDGRDEFHKKIAKKALNLMNANQSRLVNKEFGFGVIQYLSGDINPDQWDRFQIIEAAYKSCPADDILAELYGEELLRERRLNEANSVLEPLVRQRKYPTALSEFLFAQVRHLIGDTKTAKPIYQRLIQPQNLYLNNYDKAVAKNLLEEINRENGFSSKLVAVGLLLIGSMIMYFFYRRKNSKE